MTNIKSKIEVAANLSIIAVAVLLGVVLVKSWILPAPVQESAGGPAETMAGIKRGDTVAVSGIDWRKNGKTLLLALSTTCHFCTRSGPFYQRLAKERGETRLVALVPQPTEEGHSYLKKLHVNVDDIRQVSLGDIGLSGTPTLILVDGEGVATDVWVGALTPNKEIEVISRLSAERASK